MICEACQGTGEDSGIAACLECNGTGTSLWSRLSTNQAAAPLTREMLDRAFFAIEHPIGGWGQ